MLKVPRTAVLWSISVSRRLKNSTVCPNPRLPSARPSSPSRRGAASTVPFAWSPTPAGGSQQTLDDILAEAVALADQGVREINLLGQNVNAYRGLSHEGDVIDMATLVTYIAAIDGIDRIRYTTSHPVEFNQNLIDTYDSVPELVSHLHLPVQHGSDRILALMKRGHTVLEYKSTIRKLRAIRPNISISSDFIVGFPGETDKDFEDTMNLIAENRI